MRDATPWDGNGGIVTFGISAIEAALWDIAGRIAGDPERIEREFRGTWTRATDSRRVAGARPVHCLRSR